MTLFTNAPLWLMVVLALAGAGLLGTGLQRDQKPLRTWGFALIVIALLLGVLRWAVPTDEKTVERKTRELVAAVSNAKWETVDQLLKHASMMGWEGDELARQTQRFAEQFHLQSVSVTSLAAEYQPQVFIVTLSVVSHHPGEMYETVLSRWHLEYQKRLGEWMLINVTPLQIGTADASEAERMLRGAR